jgi:hypothetical protein
MADIGQTGVSGEQSLLFATVNDDEFQERYKGRQPIRKDII